MRPVLGFSCRCSEITAAPWATRVSFAVTRITPGHTLSRTANSTCEGVVQAHRRRTRKAHLRQQSGPQFRLEERRRLSRKISSRGTSCRMQRDRYAIAGERWNDRCLIANAVEPILRRRADISIRNMGDRDRLASNCSAPQASSQGVDSLAASSRGIVPSDSPSLRDTAAAPRSRGLQCLPQPVGYTISSGIEHQLRGVRNLSGLRRRQTKIHLESNPSLRVRGRA